MSGSKGGVWVDRTGTVYCMKCAMLMQFDTGECPIPFDGVDEPHDCGLCGDDILPPHNMGSLDKDMAELGLVPVEGPIPADLLADMERDGMAEYIA